jgi:parallel beta-helix repeat protein
MKRPIWIVLMIIFLVSTSLSNLGGETNEVDINEPLVIGRESRGNTLYVGSGQTYSNIQEAVENASAGDVIRVYAGTYPESISLNKQLSLIGNGSAVTIINRTTFAEGIYINVDRCVVKGFTIFDGITITSSNNNIINECILDGDGVFIDNSDNNKIENIVSNNNSDDGNGVYVYQSHYNQVLNSTCNFNDFCGIYLKESNYNTITNTTCNSNSLEGIYLTQARYNILDNCITNSNAHRGIHLGVEYSVARKCVTKYNQVGIYNTGSENIIIECDVSSNNINGINVGNAVGNSIMAYNNCSNNEIGIEIMGWKNNIFKYNNLMNNMEYGLEINTISGGNFLIHHNNFIDNKGSSQALDKSPDNDWDINGEGNHWSDWITPDNNKDGIIDYPYDIPGTGNSKDYFPLLNPVNITNLPPVAKAGPDQYVLVDHGVTFIGNGSFDPLNDKLNFKWDFGDGSSTGWQDEPNTNHAYQNPGKYNATLSVTDYSFTIIDNCTIHVTRPPVANAGPDRIVKLNKTIFFNGSGSYDPDGDKLRYNWSFGDNTFSGWSNNPNSTHSFNKTGVYNVTLFVSDGFAVVLDNCIINVISRDNGTPIIKPTFPTKIKAKMNFGKMTLNLTNYEAHTNPRVSGNQLNWTITGNSNKIFNIIILNLTNWDIIEFKSITNQIGAENLTYILTDPFGNNVSINQNVIVQLVNNAPIANAGSDQKIKFGENISLNGKGSYDPDNDPLTYNWTSNLDGFLGSGKILKNVSLSKGNHTITLTVSDGKLQNSDTCLITVTDKNQSNGPKQNFYYMITIESVSGGSLSISNMRFQCYSKDGQLLFNKTIADADPEQITRGVSSIYPVPWYSSTVNDGTGNIVNSYTELKFYSNCIIAYIDHDSNARANPNNGYDLILLYTDPDVDGIDEVSVGDEFRIIDGNDKKIGSAFLPDKESNNISMQIDIEGKIDGVFDTDGDGLPDNWEIEFGLDPGDPLDALQDFDNDSLSNLNEFLIGTDPTNYDSDGDGYSDKVDDYPNDPEQYKEKNVNDKEGSTVIPVILAVILVIVILVLLILSLIVLNKNRDSNSENIETTNIEDKNLAHLMHEILDENKDTELSNDELKTNLEQKKQAGEMSPETYDYMKKLIENDSIEGKY